MPTVLLIEDDAESRRVTADLFTREDWTILEAGDGEAGISLALERRPELVLCDLLMPKVNGFQVCRSIRQHLQRSRIIIVSGRDYGVDRASAIEAGADEYLVKPISWEILREVIDRVLPAVGDGPPPTGPAPGFHAALNALAILGCARLDSCAGFIHCRLWREYQLHRGAGGRRDHRPRCRLRHARAGYRTGRGIWRPANQADSSHFPHPLGSYPGSALFPPGLQ